MKRSMRCLKRVLFLAPLAALSVFPAFGADMQFNGDVLFWGTLNAPGLLGSGAGITGIPFGSIVNFSITADQLAEGAVTEDALPGRSVATGKLSFYGRVAVVATAGGDYANPADAMTAYATWCPAPSASTPCLLKIMPGVYSVSSPVVMQPYIDIEGAGENVTVIQGAISGNNTGLVNGASNTEIRFLTVRNTGAGDMAIAFYDGFASPKITNVTAEVTGGTGNSYGVYNRDFSSPVMNRVAVTASGEAPATHGVYNSNSSSPVMTDVTVTVSGTSATTTYGVLNFSSSPAMTNVTVAVTGGEVNEGVFNVGSSPVMTNVQVTASGGA